MDLPLRPNYRGGQLVVEYATVCFRSQEDCGPIWTLSVKRIDDGHCEYTNIERVLLRMLSAGTVHTLTKLWQKEFRSLKSLVEHMNCLMIAAGFPIFANRFNQVLNYFSPVRERFPDSITDKSAFDTDILYGRRRPAEFGCLFADPAKPR
jgi:hypothetical protein